MSVKISDPSALKVIPTEVWTQAEAEKLRLYNDPKLDIEAGLQKFRSIQAKLGAALTQLGIEASDDPKRSGPGLHTFTLQAMRGGSYAQSADAALTAAAIMIAAERGLGGPGTPVPDSSPLPSKPPFLVGSAGGTWPGLNGLLRVEAKVQKLDEGALEVKVQEEQGRREPGLHFDVLGDVPIKWEPKADTAATISLAPQPSGHHTGSLRAQRGSVRVEWRADYDPASGKLRLELRTERDRGSNGQQWQGQERLSRKIELET